MFSYIFIKNEKPIKLKEPLFDCNFVAEIVIQKYNDKNMNRLYYALDQDNKCRILEAMLGKRILESEEFKSFKTKIQEILEPYKIEKKIIESFKFQNLVRNLRKFAKKFSRKNYKGYHFSTPLIDNGKMDLDNVSISTRERRLSELSSDSLKLLSFSPPKFDP